MPRELALVEANDELGNFSVGFCAQDKGGFRLSLPVWEERGVWSVRGGL